MFQFPWLSLTTVCVRVVVTRHDPCRVFPFGDPRICACLAAPRGLSQPATSFIGFQRLDIHRVPFATCRDDARARYGVLKVRRRYQGGPLAGGRVATGSSVGPWPVRDTARPGTTGRAAHITKVRIATLKAAQCVRCPRRGPIRSVITAQGGPPNAVREVE
jgi:hypothetical protein